MKRHTVDHGDRPTVEDRGHRPQVCPHGSALPCSQCMGFVARKVKYDPIGEVMTIDGEVSRESMFDPNEKINKERAKRGRETARKTPRCSQCGHTGHSRLTCGR